MHNSTDQKTDGSLSFSGTASPLLTLLPALLLALSFLLLPGNAQATGGEVEWQYRDTQTGKQTATAAALDQNLGEMVITGYTDSNNDDFYTIKINATGDGLKWTAPAFDRSGGEDRSEAVVIDSAGDVIITGHATNNDHNLDLYTIKYDGTTGAVLWEKSYNGTNNGDDYAVSIGIDHLNNIYVGGYTPNNNAKDDFLVLKYSPDGSLMWDKTYDNPTENNHDRIVALSVGLDGVAVTGKSFNSTDWDILTVKYNLLGNFLWAKPYNSGFGNDEGAALDIDANGNVIVTGSILNGSANSDIYTVKYDSGTGNISNGMEMTYADPNGGADQPRALKIDANGDIFVTGSSSTITGQDDFVTIRYSGSDGSLIWKMIYASSGNNSDIPVSLAVNDIGVLVSGYTMKDLADDDFTTIKYNKDNGHEMWPTPSFYNNTVNKDDQSVYVSLDDNGTVYVAGWSDNSANATIDYDYYALRYDPGALNTPANLSATTVDNNTIDLAWVDNSSSPNEDQFLIDRKLGIDGTWALIGSVGQNVVYYRDDNGGGGLTPHSKYYYRVRGYNTTLEEYSNYSSEVYAQTTLITINYTPNWLYSYNGPDDGDDEITAISVGPDQNPVVTGFSTIAASFDYYTVKLDRILNGGNVVELWDDSFDDEGNGDDMAEAITVNDNNEVIVSGNSLLFTIGIGSSNDIYTRKYAADGPPAFGSSYIWDDQYNGPDAGDDHAVAIAKTQDNSGKTAVIGYGLNAAGDNDILVLYLKADGTRLWADVYNPENGDDRPVALAFDSAGDVIVTSRATIGGDYDIVTRKYCTEGTSAACTAASKTAGQILWSTTYDSDNGADEPSAVITDNGDDVYVAGYVTNASANKDFYIVRLSGVDGSEVWASPLIEDGPNHGDDWIVGLGIDRNDNEIVTAGTWNLGIDDSEFRMTRYRTDKTVVWDRLFDSPSTDDNVQALGLDVSGNFCVAGTSKAAGTTDLLAVKYDYSGEVLGTLVYDGGQTPAKNDEAVAITVNRFGEAFVAGNLTKANNSQDYLVLLCEGDVLQSPAPLTATPYYTTVDFTWVNDNAPEADGFQLEGKTGTCPFVDTDTTWQHSFGIGTTSFSEENLAIDQTYCFRLKASVSATGVDSRWLTREVSTITPPAPDSLTSTTLNTTRVQLNWLDTVNAEESWLIERCADTLVNCGIDNANYTFLTSADANTTSKDDPTVCPEQPYTYRVRAINTLWGEEPLWAYDEVTPPPAIDAPAITATNTISESRIDVSWSDSNEDETGFHVFRCTGPACVIDALNDTPVATIIAPTDSLFSLKMDEAAWTAGNPDALDNSGNNHHGTPNGDANRGVFDGDNDYITLGDIDAMDAPAAFSFEIRFRRDAETATSTNHGINNVLIAQSSDSSNDNFEIGTQGGSIEIYLDTAGGLNETKSVETGLQVDAGIQDNVWYHLVFTYDKDAADTNEAKLYLDGVLLTQWSDPEGLLADTSTSQLTIGLARPESSLWGDFKGEIDEVTVYNHALTSGEISNYFTNGNIPTSYTDLPLSSSTTYHYQVTAFKTTPTTCATNTGWESAASGYDEAVTTGIMPPTLQSAATDLVERTTEVNLSWIDNTENEENFVVERCNGDCTGSFSVDNSFTVGANGGMSGTVNWTDTTACQGTYTYRVKATRTTAPAWNSTTSTAELVATTFVKSTPVMISATKVNEEEIELTWTDNTTDETYFTVEHCIGASCKEVTVPSSAGLGNMSFVVTHLTPDSTYDFQVKAVKDAGICSWNTAYTTPQVSTNTNITTPFNLTPSYPNTTQIDLSWTDPTAREHNFVLERCTGNCSGTFTVDQTNVLDAGGTSHSDTTVCESSVYTYRIRAIDQDFGGGWNGCWTKRQRVNVTGFTPDTVIAFTVNYIAGQMQTDFDDLRFYSFTDATETDGEIIPHVVESKTDGVSARIILKTPANGAFLYMYYGNPDAVMVQEDYTRLITTLYDDFQGTVIDTDKWVEIDPNGQISQNNDLNLTYVDTSWNAALISKQSFVRQAGTILLMNIQPQNGPTYDYFMAGWDIDQTTDPSYSPNMVHGLFWPNFGNLSAYAKGSSRGYTNATPYSANIDYTMRINLRGGTDKGADYYIKGGAYLDWRFVERTVLYNDDPLRIGIHQARAQAKINWVAVIEPSKPTVGFVVDPDPTCNDLPYVWESDNTVIVTTAKAAVEPAFVSATAISESEIKLIWTDNNSDETSFLLERCQGNDAECTAGSPPNFDWSLPMMATPMLKYAMEEASWPNDTAAVVDSSGNGNYGTVKNGPTIVTDGTRGKVGNFDGYNDYLLINNSTSLQDVTDSSFTFEAWARPDTVPPATDANPPTNNWYYAVISRPGYHSTLRYDYTQKYSFNVWNDVNQYFGITSSNTYAPGTWHHIVATVDDAQKKIYLYIDGLLQASGTYTGTLRDYGTNPYYVGVATPGASYNWYFDGRIDDVAIYNYALSKDIISWHSGTLEDYSDSDLELSTEYTYRLKAIKDTASSCYWITDDTVRITETTMAPPRPIDLVATKVNTTQINLVWKDKTGSNTNFEIQRALYNAGTWGAYGLIATVGPDVESYSDTGVCNGTQYKYRVRAIGVKADNTSWQSLWSNDDPSDTPKVEVSATTYAMVTPTLNSATRVSESRINLTWTDTNSDESGFDIERCLSASNCATPTIIPVGPGLLSYSDTGLSQGQTYYYRIRAKKTASCEGGWVTPYHPTLPGDALFAITNIVDPVLATTTGVTTDPGNTTQAVVTWTDNSETESGFKIWRCENDVQPNCTDDGNFILYHTTGANQTSWTDNSVCTDIGPGKTYTYKVEAISENIPITGLPNSGGGTWIKRRPLSFTTLTPDSVAFVTIAYDSDMQADFDDLRFVDDSDGTVLPYSLDSKTNGVEAKIWVQIGSNDSINLYYGNNSATTASTSLENVLITNAEFYDDFTGTVINSAKWVEIDPSNKISQNNGLQLGYVNYNWDAALISQQTISRIAGKTLLFKVNMQNAPASDYFALGWGLNQTSAASYTQTRYIFYWNNFYSWQLFYPYVSGSPYSSNTTDYLLRIELKADGAKYYIKGGAYSNWTMISDNTSYNDTPLRVHIAQKSQQARIDLVAVFTLPVVTVGNEEVTSFEVWNSLKSNADSATTAAYTMPTMDDTNTTSLDETSIKVTWTDVNPDESYFRVYRGASDCTGFTEIGQTAGPDIFTFVDTGADLGGGQLAYNTTYCYQVQAHKDTGGNCDWDSGFTTTATATTDVPVPENLVATPTETTKITLVWDVTTTSETGLIIERCTGDTATCDANSGSLFSPLTTVGPGITTYTDSTLCPTTTYSYRVKAERSGIWTSNPSLSDDAITPGPPVAPSALALTEVYNQDNDNKNIDLIWIDTNPDEDGFVIERCNQTTWGDCDSADTNFSPIRSVLSHDEFNTQVDPFLWSLYGCVGANCSATAPIDLSDAAGSVKIYNDNGEAALDATTSSTSGSSRNSLYLTMACPESLGSGDLDLQFDWNLPAVVDRTTMAPSAGHYHIYLRLSIKVGLDKIIIDRDVRDYADYYWGILQHNGVTVGTFYIGTSDNAGKFRVTRTGATMTLYNWDWNTQDWNILTSYADADIGSTPSLVQIQQTIDQREPGTSISTHIDNFKINSGIIPACTDRLLTDSTDYYYRVRAVKETTCPAWDDLYTVKENDLTNPAATTLTVTTEGSRKLWLSWIDNATDEEGYEITQKIFGGNFVKVGETPANAEEFTVTRSLEPNTTYTYRIRSHRDNYTSFSAYSNEASATTDTLGGSTGDDSTCPTY